MPAQGFFGFGAGPRFFGVRPASSPRSRCARQVVEYEEYNPSRRSRAPIAPGAVQASASRRIFRLYSAVNRRRLALATTSTSGTPGLGPVTSCGVLISWVRIPNTIRPLVAGASGFVISGEAWGA